MNFDSIITNKFNLDRKSAVISSLIVVQKYVQISVNVFFFFSPNSPFNMTDNVIGQLWLVLKCLFAEF